MIPKVTGNFNVEKLCAILLYEADFNHNNKKLGRDMMYTAEDLRLIAREQYGSRKFFVAIDHCLNKTLSCNIGRQTKRCFAICSNDAKSCYNRIVHAVAKICMHE